MLPLPWAEIDTVLLDMDGTLLDLHFDNYFWLHHLPACYAKQHRLSLEQAKAYLQPLLASYQGQLAWYCTDFWSEKLQLPIVQMKRDTAEKIAWRPEAQAFLQRLGAMGKQRVLITNAHPDSLQIKLEQVALAPYLDQIISSHTLGYPKEDQCFWQALQAQLQFSRARSVFFDDSEAVLTSAQHYGVAHTLAIAQPDSQGPLKHYQHFSAVQSFMALFES